MTRFEAQRVVFDLDGTLVDSAPDLTEALNHVLTELGRPAVDIDDVRHMVGQGARKLIELGLASTGGADGTDMDTLLDAFLAHYADHVADHTRPFPGALALIDRLTAAGVRLGLCTNKPIGLTRTLMAALDLDRHFDTMIGGDSLEVRKPDPRPLQMVLDGMAGNGAALMVGDTATDVATARNAGVPVVVVRFGYSRTPVDALGADLVIDDFDAPDRWLALP